MARWEEAPAVEPNWMKAPPVEQPQEQPQFRTKTGQVLSTLKDYGISALRAVPEGAVSAVSVFADPAAYLINRGSEAVGGRAFLPENVSQQFKGTLTDMGVPEPQTTGSASLRDAVEIASSMYTGGAGGNAFAARIGATPTPVNAPRPVAENPGAATLMNRGVPLDRAQQSGGRFAQMLRSAVANHPMTADRQIRFAEGQQKAFNRAVLRSIGVNSDEASQAAMNSAKTRIGNMFNSVGKDGAVFDDVLQTRLAEIMDELPRTLKESSQGIIRTNVDDILNGVDDTGNISGKVFNQVRSRLGRLSGQQGVGQVADDIQEALLDALERSNPQNRELLNVARQQWRNMRIIEPAIDKGVTGNISPSILANQWSLKANRAAGVYGQGGDQGLVGLAQAGKSVLPQQLPDSGTIPRGLMQAPLRAIATAPIYRGAQNYLLSQPQPGSGVLRPELIGAAALGAYRPE